MADHLDRASERTPLLSDHRESGDGRLADSNGGPAQHQLVNLDNIERTLQLTGEGHTNQFDAAAILSSVQALSVSTEHRIALLLLLCLRHIERIAERRVGVSAAAKQATSKQVEAVEKLRDETYDQLCEESSEFIEEVLWTGFPRGEEGGEEIAVMDVLFKRNTFTELSTHSRIHESLLNAWEQGITSTPLAHVSFAQRVRSLATPRVLHAIELAFHVLYLGILTTYVLHPHTIIVSPSAIPSPSPTPIPYPLPSPTPVTRSTLKDWRISSLIVYTLSRIFQSQAYHRGPFLVVFTCFFIHVLRGIPPGPNDSAYVFLLLMLATQLFELHSTRPPSPVLTLMHTRALPLARVIETLGSEAWAPAFAFFFPILYVLFVLLSTSAADTFGLKLRMPFTFAISFPWSVSNLTTEPAPGLARALFAASIILVLISIILFAAAMTMLLPSFPWQRRPSNPWDAFGPAFGFQTRETIYLAIKTYSQPFVFPAPLNILSLIFVSVPTVVLSLVRLNGVAAKLAGTISPILWNIFVLPFVCAFSLLWPLDSVRRLRVGTSAVTASQS